MRYQRSKKCENTTQIGVPTLSCSGPPRGVSGKRPFFRLRHPRPPLSLADFRISRNRERRLDSSGTRGSQSDARYSERGKPPSSGGSEGGGRCILPLYKAAKNQRRLEWTTAKARVRRHKKGGSSSSIGRGCHLRARLRVTTPLP